MAVLRGVLDELAPVAPASVAYINGGKFTRKVHSVEMDVKRCTIEDLAGGTAEENARVIEGVFNGDEISVADAILLNAAAECVVSIVRVRAAIKNRTVVVTLQKWAAVATAALAIPNLCLF